jgi:cbb3-type cytochrome oxidase maturation protein
MGIIYFLITVSIIIAAFFVLAFIKAVKSGQFDDDYTPSVRMLFEDELKPTKNTRIELQKTKTKNQKSNTKTDKNS